MSLDTVLLHVLIVLSPTLIASLIYDKSAIGGSPYFVGTLNGIAAVLCVIYPYMTYGMHWDLRFLPFIVACLYGGPYAGGLVWAAIAGARAVQGTEGLAFDLGVGVLIAVLPLAMCYVIRNRRDYMLRLKAIVIIGLWVGIVKLFAMYLYYRIEGVAGVSLHDEPRKLIVTSLIYGVVFSVVFLMNEGMIERRRMKLEIARSEKLNALGEIAASIAHEIRNPLTVVKGFLQLMKQRETGKSSQYLPLILAELARAETILNEYLSYAKPHLATTERVQVASIVENIVVLLEPLSIIQGVQLESRLSVNPAVSGDRNQLQQALLNITKNGIEATPAGGKVTLQLTNDNEWAYIKITDTGRGMSKEHLDRLGTLFYSTKDKGTGLGMTVSWQIVRNMNGTIHYESKLNVGTEALIKLPIAK
ncbi:ATP-binding protein [Cohnella sp. GCM10027633]|uniref:ATP-binding protein n=1 Tax=unclassified Cohnella TaxID=2636738 RepID=UPI00363153AD